MELVLQFCRTQHPGDTDSDDGDAATLALREPDGTVLQLLLALSLHPEPSVRAEVLQCDTFGALTGLYRHLSLIHI